MTGSTSTSEQSATRVQRWRMGGRAWPVIYFLAIALTYFHPVLKGMSSSVVPAMQERLWPWRGWGSPQHELAPQLDGAVSSYPWSVLMHESMSRGAFPFWDWNSFSGGYDLVSDGVSGAMYPLHWVVWLLFEPALAHDLFMMAHVWLGGVVMFALLRHWGLRSPAALVGGTAWALAPFNTAWMQAEMITPVLLCVPLTFLTMSRVLRRPGAVRVLAASAALALALVAGNVVVFLVLVWVVGLFGLAVVCLHGIQSRSRLSASKRLGVLAAAAIGAGVLSAYSLLPTMLNLTSLGRRTPTLQESLPAQGTLDSVWLSMWSAPPMEDTGSLFVLVWCGRVVLVLALVGLLHRGMLRWGASLLALTFALLPVTPLLVEIGWYVVPPLRAVSGFGRLTFLATFGVILLSALGFQLLLTALGTVLRLRPSWVPGARAVAIVLAVVAMLAELIPFARTVNPTYTDRSAANFYPDTAAHQAVQAADRQGKWPGLLLPLSVPSADPIQPWDGAAFWGTTSIVSGIDSVGGYDSAVPRRATALTRVLQGVPIAEATAPFNTAFLPTFSLIWARLDLAARVGVTHVYIPPGADLSDSAYAGVLPIPRVSDTDSGQVFRLDDSLRQPRLVATAHFEEGAEQVLETYLSPEHDPEASVVLQAVGAEPPTSSSSPLAQVGSVRSSVRGSNFARVAYKATAAAWLVVPIGFDAGWTAELGDQALPTRAADYAFTAVRVPPGNHRVTFSYRPEGFRTGALISLAGILLSGTVLARAARRRRLGGNAQRPGMRGRFRQLIRPR